VGRRASERNFTRVYKNRYQVPLTFGALVETCIACLYSNLNIDKTVIILIFINKLIVILATALH